MEEGDCDFRENKVVEEAPKVSGDEAVVDDSVDVKMFDDLPVRVRHFYFVKVLPLESSNTDAMIKAEETIEKMNQDQILIAPKIRERQKLSFLMVHGCKNMADERAIKGGQCKPRESGGFTVDEVHAPIQPLRLHMCGRRWLYKMTDIYDVLENAGERAVADAVVNGKLWNSLGSRKETIRAEVLNNRSDELRKRQTKVRVNIRKTKKELERFEKNRSSLQKCLIDMNRRKDEAFSTILKLKKQYGEENACYYLYCSLMNKVEVLATKKDIAALQESSQGQVEKLMQQWNNYQDFRNDYTKRVVPSLNSRHLGNDGRMFINQKPPVEDARKVIKPEALSKTRLKWLMKDAEDPSELLSL